MAVDAGQIKIDPYTSTVPVVQVPPSEIDAQTRPAGPLPGQFGKKGTGALAIGDSLLKGFMQGHAMLAEKKAKQANATITALDNNVSSAYQQYQDSLASGGDKTATDAAYANYLDQFNKSKEAKAKFVIPEKKGKGGSSSSTGGATGGKKDDKKGGAFGGIKDFMEANPHIIPQIALMTMQPKPPGLNRETRQAEAQTKAAEAQAKLAGVEVTGEEQRQKDQAYQQSQRVENDQRVASERAVEEKGGVDAVLADKNASPETQQAARRMKYQSLDSQSPEAKMKLQYQQQLLNGSSKSWTPEQRMLAGSMGVVPMPMPQTITGKNGHKQQVLIDPTTNQPVPGSKPLDLGPPQWAQEFYAKRGADKADIHKAIAADPAQYGVMVTGNPQADKAAIDARSEQLYIKSSFGISSLADTYGSTGFEVQRNNAWIGDANKELSTLFVGKKKDDKGADPTVDFEWPGGQKVALNKTQVNQIMNQFVTDPTQTNGISTFRATPEIWPGKDPQAAERDRQWAYQFMKNRMMSQKGKAALTSEQADQILKRDAPALSTPIAMRGGMTPPPTARTSGSAFTSGMTAPPQAPSADWSHGTGVTDEDLAKQ